MLNAIVKRRLAALIVGAVGLVVGIVLLSSTEVKCDNKTMSQGDVCVMGNGTRNSYDEMKTADQRTGYLAIGFGALALLVGGAGFALGGRPQGTRPV